VESLERVDSGQLPFEYLETEEERWGNSGTDDGLCGMAMVLSRLLSAVVGDNMDYPECQLDPPYDGGKESP
jgi:hypothetical protein